MTLKRGAAWILAVLLAAEFCLAGARKFAASSTWPRMFLEWGYPSWVRPVVGATEIVCGLALLVPRLRRWGCVGLLAIMAGAAATHVAHGQLRRVILNVALSALLGALMRVRSPDSRSA